MIAEAPNGFLFRQFGKRSAFLAEEAADALTSLGFVCGEATTDPVRVVVGREKHPIYRLPGEETQVLWKRCFRGGLMEHLLKDRHFKIERFLRELEHARAARRAGLGVAEPLGLAVESGQDGFKRVEMISRIVVGAQDLGTALLDRDFDGRDRQRLLTAVAGELRRFHGHGFLHGDLNVKNVLWRRGSQAPKDDFEITLIDLDPGAWRLTRGLSHPHQNLMRLFRSYAKGAWRGRWELSRCEIYRFLTEYFRGDHVSIGQFWREAGRRQSRWRLLRFRLKRAPR